MERHSLVHGTPFIDASASLCAFVGALALCLMCCTNAGSHTGGSDSLDGNPSMDKSTGDDGQDGGDGSSSNATDGQDSGDSSTSTDGSPRTQLPEIKITELPASLATMSKFFTKYVNVFGVHIVASPNTPDSKVLHAAHVMAQYLDNNEDGTPDNPAVIDAMVKNPGGATLVMFETDQAMESSGLFDMEPPAGLRFQDLYGSETHPEGSSDQKGFDATLEEVLHLITGKGFSIVYSQAFGEDPGSLLGNAMDKARGGQFMSVPATYPPGAWYHYNDKTCDYRCQVTEYFYWALTSILGAQNYGDRCNMIADEWELCTKELVQTKDPTVYSLLTDPQYKLPTVLPDGKYGSN